MKPQYHLGMILVFLVYSLGACGGSLMEGQATLDSPPVEAATVAESPSQPAEAASTKAPTASLDPSRVPATSTPATSPNVILIIADSLRSDHLSCYGYARQTTPKLDARVAAQGVRFADATSTAPWTYPANAAIFTGRTPTELGATWTGHSMPGNVDTLAERLQAAGYSTAGFVTTYFVQAKFGFDQGFDHYDQSLSGRPASNKATAEELNSNVFSWLDQVWAGRLDSPQPLFLFVYYFDPHVWYNPPSPYDTLYDPAYTGTLTADVYQEGKDVVLGNITPTPRDVEHIQALYDGEITYWDDQFDLLLARLDELGILSNSLLIVTADHGEMFGENGKWVHGSALYEEQLRVPLLMRYPGVIPAGRVVAEPVQTIDITPTVLDFAGLGVPSGLSGISLKGSATGTGAPASSNRSVYSELDGITDPNNGLFWLAPHQDMRSARQDGWKLIHILGQTAADELYQLGPASIYETNNLIDTQPTLAESIRQALRQWFGLQELVGFLPILRQ